MKAALIVTNLRGGGAEKALIQTADLLHRAGHEATLILLEDLRQHAVPDGLPVIALGEPGKVCSKGWLGRRWLAWRLKRRMASLARDCPFDLILSTLPFADEVCRLARLPNHWMRVANTLSREIEALGRSNPAKAARRLNRYRTLYDGQRLIAVSSGVADDLTGKLAIQPRALRVVRNPFDLEGIPSRARASVAGLPTEPYAIHVGRSASQKRHDLLLDAWSRIREPRLLVLLTDPDPGLHRLIEARGLTERVRIAGFQVNPYPWIAGARLLILCSDHEGMPNVLIEALACGTPVVSTDCPSGPRELLEADLPEALVAMGDVEALTGGIERMLARPDAARRVDLSGYAPEVALGALEGLSLDPARGH
ncbi:N-acetylgalactosamine-N, N'-diacetylbacillosaminyl-diphospho-undecaprenol4-alpha-N-acetylgalactosaminyltransferase [Candidatus Magnetaquicoccaceae bacterium FCR-1]|uniref:N-acetylgalactosamine-N, N'-diacetylbacillosaminyl-diphospho-undecaprenol4-alpha-N-acetylgalactosaminyltransferase n=1 Tax=Candidatus Magnetaquiglobus chichijimensis TaxID=3141448 RepID=A0ABQ0CBH1_9PROT